jgi:hypothetical protein
MDSNTLLLKIYPSGFLGSGTVTQTEPINMVANVRNLLNKDRVIRTTPYTASADVVGMWDDAMVNAPEFKSFDYKEKILVVAMKAFGTSSIKQWVDAQVDNPMCGDSHYRWIDETLHYVMTGARRQYQYNTWLTILSTSRPDAEAKGYSKVMHQYFSTGTPALLSFSNKNPKTMSIVDFIAAWVSRPNGIEDLTASLNVLFGKR